eukprot:TRINITY_DN26053_c0_g1_i1.p1 TRINITY_DN26053_c0_g1~~TRINITY_DN26053_c0_g1_i1.p1  ORF type:complete len:167 (-),score=28.86 TRINITY_DN26053_c0_g1_i1:272-772(-)
MVALRLTLATYLSVLVIPGATASRQTIKLDEAKGAKQASVRAHGEASSDDSIASSSMKAAKAEVAAAEQPTLPSASALLESGKDLCSWCENNGGKAACGWPKCDECDFCQQVQAETPPENNNRAVPTVLMEEPPLALGVCNWCHNNGGKESCGWAQCDHCDFCKED